MVGFELKALIVILLIISIVINLLTYKEAWADKKSFLFVFEISEGSSPISLFWYLSLISLSLFTYALYLNDIPPIILF